MRHHPRRRPCAPVPRSTSPPCAPTCGRCVPGRRARRSWPWSSPTRTATARCPCARAARRGGRRPGWAPPRPRRRSALRAAGHPGRACMCWLWTPGGPWREAIEADIDVSVSGHVGAAGGHRRGPRGRPPARVQLKADTGPRAQRLPARRLARAGRRRPAPPRRDGLIARHRPVVALRLRRRARAPLDRRPARRASATCWRTPRRQGCAPRCGTSPTRPATLTLPESHFDLVRTGHRDVRHLAQPRARHARPTSGCGPVMTLAASLALVKQVPGGHGVSYGHHYVTPGETTLGAGPARLRGRHPAARLRHRARCWSPASGGRSRAGSRWTSSWSTSAATSRGAGRRGGAVRPRRPRRAHRRGLGAGGGHHRVRDRHPDRNPGAARLRERAARERAGRRGQRAHGDGTARERDGTEATRRRRRPPRRWQLAAGAGVAGAAIGVVAAGAAAGVASSGSPSAAACARRPGSRWTPPARTARCAAPRARRRRRRHRAVLRGRRGRPGGRRPRRARAAPALRAARRPPRSPSSSATATASARTPGTSSAPPCAASCAPSTGTSAATAAPSAAGPRRTARPVTIDQLGRDLKAVIDAAAPEGPLVLVGHSMGGMTVMALADQYPELVRERVVGRRPRRHLVAGGSARSPSGCRSPGVNAVRRVLPGRAEGAGQPGRAGGAGPAGHRRPVRRASSSGTRSASEDVDPAVARFAERLIEATPIDVVAEFYPAFTEHDKTEALAALRRAARCSCWPGTRTCVTPERAQRGDRRAAAGRRAGARAGRRAPGDAGAPRGGRPTALADLLAAGRGAVPLPAARASAGRPRRRRVAVPSMGHRTTRSRAGAPHDRTPSAVRITVSSPDQMRELGRRLAKLLRPGDLVLLTGELGAGKTTLTRGLGEGLGVRGAVTSPTFVIARVHPSLGGGPAAGPRRRVPAGRRAGRDGGPGPRRLAAGVGGRRGVGRGQGRGAVRGPAAGASSTGRSATRTDEVRHVTVTAGSGERWAHRWTLGRAGAA